jgi:DNA-binding XRE family transcriptional regulator
MTYMGAIFERMTPVPGRRSAIPMTGKNGGHAMDMWDFLKWRKTLRYTQAEAAKKLGIHRGTIQNWERGITPISKAAELACLELTRQWKQRPEFGPVNLIYAEAPVSQQPNDPSRTALLQCELYSTNEAAIWRALQLMETPNFINPLIIEKDGGIVWTTTELLREGERRTVEAKRKHETPEARAGPSSDQTMPTGPPSVRKGSSDRQTD